MKGPHEMAGLGGGGEETTKTRVLGYKRGRRKLVRNTHVLSDEGQPLAKNRKEKQKVTGEDR